MATGSSKYHIVVVSSASNVYSAPLADQFDLDEAMTMPENPQLRRQAVTALVSDLPAVCNANGSCSICMESFIITRQASATADDDEAAGGGGGSAARRLSCGHVYHPICISDWLFNGNSYSCPLCRREI